MGIVQYNSVGIVIYKLSRQIFRIKFLLLLGIYKVSRSSDYQLYKQSASVAVEVRFVVKT